MITIILLLIVVLWPLMLYVLPDILSEDNEEVSSWPSDEPSSWPVIAEVEKSVKVEPYNAHHPWHSLPRVINKKYLNNLVQGIQYSECVKVVVGPRDSGKTIGISMLVEAWREKGHTIVDINLKGMSKNATWEDAMTKAAEGMYEVISNLDHAKYWCILNTIRRSCSHIMSKISQNVMWQVVEGVTGQGSIVALLGTIVPVLIRLAQRIVPKKYLTYMPQQSLFYLSIVCAAIFSILVAFNYRSLIYNIITPGILHGNWNSLRCNLNAVCKCEPGKKPIVIIREISNFDDNALQECLASLEKMKEGLVKYPVILETSQFSWLKASSVYKSRLSFCPYYIEEMTQSELTAEFVDKRQLWSEKEFEKIYEALGGHMGSYSRLYMYQAYHNLTIEESLVTMRKEAVAHVCDCLNNASNFSDAMLFLATLKASNFTLRTVLVSEAMEAFIKCNIVFFNPSEMMARPHNQLLHSAITKVLQENK